jgi:isopropylmalate/homocitrate/citramalate synthase
MLVNVIKICEEALKLGVDKIGLADSGGLSTPDHTKEVLREITKHIDKDKYLCIFMIQEVWELLMQCSN